MHRILYQLSQVGKGMKMRRSIASWAILSKMKVNTTTSNSKPITCTSAWNVSCANIIPHTIHMFLLTYTHNHTYILYMHCIHTYIDLRFPESKPDAFKRHKFGMVREVSSSYSYKLNCKYVLVHRTISCSSE
jgi:hypothetical protein